jgi:alpha-amylase/alpha-mannosidase (GH57 family)
MKRYICIHGHFYQPPRENPWLEAIEIQDSAHPYHDWNERITAECYAANALSRVLDSQARIAKIVNNYARISFDVGPTLLSWMESKATGVYDAVLEADRMSRKSFSGHGSALAQIYNHTIMPLANRRQKVTQTCWAIRDFEYRFDRAPEGMWLPETAVDTETLEILAEHEIRFTILAPHQAKAWRRIGDKDWTPSQGDTLDTTMPYLCRLPSGRSIALFFYSGEISRAVAFERLLNSGEELARRLLSSFRSADRPQLAHIATDGETYGHHHPYGEMALAYAIGQIDASDQAALTNYGEYLERFPPTHEVEIHEKTAWSCAHGIERWRSDCGCNLGGHSGWNQQWRAPLRRALDWLANELSSRYELRARDLLSDPWKAQDDYIQIILDRSPQALSVFLDKHAVRPLDQAEQTRVLKLLEIQRHSMLMFTSCGWFFDDLSGIEAVQNLLYASRALQLARDVFGIDLEPAFIDYLQQARSNLPERGDGRQIYETLVRPAVTDLRKVGAHYALCSLFENYPEKTDLYCYTVYSTGSQKVRAGKASMTVGRVDISSRVTLESATLSYCAMHFGDQNLTGGVREFRSLKEHQELIKEVEEAFNSADLLRVVRLLDRHFPGGTYSLKQLFRDEQRKITRLILKGTLGEVEHAYEEIYEPSLPLMRFLEDLRVPLPKAFELAAQFVLNSRLRRALEHEPLDIAGITTLLQQARRRRIALDNPELSFRLRRLIKRASERLKSRPGDSAALARVEDVLALARLFPFPVVLWDLENVVYAVLQGRYPIMKRRADSGDETAKAWITRFQTLAQGVKVRV